MVRLGYFGTAVSGVCVISQPTFLPWLGWFDQVDQCATMVLLDDVVFAKRSWQQRNRIRTRNGLEFVTVPVLSAGRYDQRIMDCELADGNFGAKIIGTLKANYVKAPFFADNFDGLAQVIMQGIASNRLAALNCGLIRWIAAKLEITTPMLMASDLAIGGRRGEHLAAICEHLGFRSYLSAPGAEDYLLEDRQAFEAREIEVKIHVYDHPVYEQCFEPFIPYACALDLVLNEGPRAPAIMRSGRQPTRPLGLARPENPLNTEQVP